MSRQTSLEVNRAIDKKERLKIKKLKKVIEKARQLASELSWKDYEHSGANYTVKLLRTDLLEADVSCDTLLFEQDHNLLWGYAFKQENKIEGKK